MPARVIDLEVGPGAEPPPDPGLREGDSVGGYILLRPIGHGGEGHVWSARRLAGGSVAIKFLHARSGADGMDSDVVAREFGIQAELGHPHVLPVFGAGTHEDRLGRVRPFIVMLLVEDGLPIDAYCRRANLDTPSRLRLFIALVTAAAAAHRRGVFHLDIKPSNALVGRESHVWLADFGIARHGLDAPRSNRTGTPRYWSPEQCGIDDVHRLDARADVWALGLLLHQVLTGCLPTGLKALRASGSPPDAGMPSTAFDRPLAEVHPPLAKEVPHLLPGLDDLIGRCLQIDREKRPDDASEILRACRDVVTATGLVSFVGRMVGGRPRRVAAAARLSVMFLAMLLALVVTGPLLGLTRAPAEGLRRIATAPFAAAAAEQSSVTILEFGDESLEQLRDTVPEASQARPGRADRVSCRPLYAALIRELAGRPPRERPRAIVLDFFLKSVQPRDGELVEAIAFAHERGVPVILATDAYPDEPGAPPVLSRVVLDSPAAWGVAIIAEELEEPRDSTISADLLAVRDGELLASSIVLLAAIAQAFGHLEVTYDLGPDRLLVADTRSRRLGSAPRLLVPITVDAMYSGHAELNLRSTDVVHAISAPVADMAVLEKHVRPFSDAWSASGSESDAIAGRTVFVIDSDYDPSRPSPVRQAGRGLALATHSITGNRVLIVADAAANVPLLIAGALAGLIGGSLVAGRHVRATTVVRSDGGRRRAPSPRLDLASALLGLLLAAVVVLPVAGAAEMRTSLVLHPAPALVAGSLAAVLALRVAGASDFIVRILGWAQRRRHPHGRPTYRDP